MVYYFLWRKRRGPCRKNDKIIDQVHVCFVHHDIQLSRTDKVGI